MSWAAAMLAAPASVAAASRMDSRFMLTPFGCESCCKNLFGPGLLLGAPADGDRQLEVLALALELDLGGAAGSDHGNHIQHALRVGDLPAVDLQQHVARLDAGLVGGPVAEHALDDRALERADLEGLG